MTFLRSRFLPFLPFLAFGMMACVSDASGSVLTKSDFGLASIEGKAACVSAPHIQDETGKEITVVLTGKRQQHITGTIEREATNECERLEKAFQPRPYYLVKLRTGEEYAASLGVAILKPLDYKESSGKVTASAIRNGISYQFSECTGAESAHLFVWARNDKGWKPIWHAYFYLSYDVDPSCGKRERKAIDKFNRPPDTDVSGSR